MFYSLMQYDLTSRASSSRPGSHSAYRFSNRSEIFVQPSRNNCFKLFKPIQKQSISVLRNRNEVVKTMIELHCSWFVTFYRMDHASRRQRTIAIVTDPYAETRNRSCFCLYSTVLYAASLVCAYHKTYMFNTLVLSTQTAYVSFREYFCEKYTRT
jgi:hypothetical protein